MYKKSFYLTAVLSASMFAACQSGPTIIDSTKHKHEGEKPVSNVLTSKGSTNSESSGHGNTGHEKANHSEMNHSEMKSAPNAASQPFDLQFLDTMIAHHEGAVEMAKDAGTKSANAGLKTFAQKIVADQTREITEMKKWREQWFAGKPAALNMEMTGMADSMKGMDMMKLNAASGSAFDTEFINQMTPHHEGAIAMAKEALTKAEHAEIKTLANQIIAAQEAEIKQMQGFKTTPAK
ncbi:MAG: DUF305 domain-containing protein [Pyrinomonadaceae bacterium]|nr:DUF305 domain-containing protein [Pyrinomonadaceae bacterium]